jgi:hypothetical protein
MMGISDNGLSLLRGREADEAIQSREESLDCFASLAMTARSACTMTGRVA